MEPILPLGISEYKANFSRLKASSLSCLSTNSSQWSTGAKDIGVAMISGSTALEQQSIW